MLILSKILNFWTWYILRVISWITSHTSIYPLLAKYIGVKFVTLSDCLSFFSFLCWWIRNSSWTFHLPICVLIKFDIFNPKSHLNNCTQESAKLGTKSLGSRQIAYIIGCSLTLPVGHITNIGRKKIIF